MHLPPVVTCTEVLQKPFNAKSTSVTPELIYRPPPPPQKKYGFTQGKFIIINIIHMQENLTMRPYCSAHSLPEKTTTTSEVTSHSNTPHSSHFPVRNPSTD